MTLPRAEPVGEDHYRLSPAQRRLLPFVVRFSLSALALAWAVAMLS